jgi:hypothetical protein
MKKLLLLLFSILSFSSLQAQETTYGITTGVNFSTVTTDGSSLVVNAQDDFVTNFTIGAFLDHPISEKVGVKFDLSYVFRDIPTFSTSTFQDVRLRGFDITPLLKVSLGENYNEGFSFLLGPRASFLLAADSNSGLEDAKDAFKSTSFGLQAGMLQTLSKYTIIELKVDYGFSVSDEAVTGNNINIVSVFLSLNLDVKGLLAN